MGIAFIIAGIGLLLLLVSCAIAFWVIPKFARTESVSWLGWAVVVVGMVVSFLYYPAYDKHRKKEIINIQLDHLKKSTSLKIYKTVENITGVIVEDALGRGQYRPWNRPLPPCYRHPCDPMLPGEAQPRYAIRIETLSPHSPVLQVVPGVNIFVCRKTVYDRTTGETLSRLFEYGGTCTDGNRLTDQDVRNFQSVLKPAS